ncbi:MAG: thiamine pyrophosphate-binding protein [Planctomycetota bacterium]|nr:thiamine pyrophosphate-binding protein [Planctomycetota bacterium]MDA1249961.1 thiamine pyrophosphate-binding protein [Planctomycetota bacterium]
MFNGSEIANLFEELGVTHVVTVPDTTIGPWLAEIRATSVDVIQVCREGEAWGIAMGLYLGGATPIVLIQCTGLFESGDALRNAIYDYRLPLFGLVGYRSYLSQASLPGDTCLRFTEPILDAWEVDSVFVDEPGKLGEIATHFRACQAAGKPGIVLFAEGKA